MIAIQPCAILLLVGSDWRVEAASLNAAGLGKGPPERLVGRPLADISGDDAIHTLRNHLAWLGRDGGVIHHYAARWDGADTVFDISTWADDGDYLVELEAAVEPRLSDPIGMAFALMDRVTADDLPGLAEQGLTQLCALTGFGRLALHGRSDGVFASVARRGAVPIGDNPTADLPESPRLLADRDAAPVAMVGATAHRLLDRSAFLAPPVDACARLAEVGIAATMDMPLRIDGHTVGAIHAAHAAPRRCGAERRSVASLFADRLAARLLRAGWQP